MNVLAIGCHPDDLEIACSGTLRKYVETGAEVYMCHVANGNQGHVVIEPDPLREIRTLEAENAGKIIGAKEVEDGTVSVRNRDTDQTTVMTVDELIAMLKEEISERK